MDDYRVTDTDVLIIGSGTGAVAVASELIKKNRYITVVEQGKRDTDWGNDFIERANNIYKKNGNLPETDQGIKYYRHLGYGGTLEISCGNGILPPENYLNKIEMDIKTELDAIHEELKINPVPVSKMGSNTKQLMDAAHSLSLNMVPTPKFIDFEKCKKCAQCELICQHGARWSVAQKFNQLEKSNNLHILDGIKIDKIEFNQSKAVAAMGKYVKKNENGNENKNIRIEAETIILAAGGIGTPVILQKSGIKAGTHLHLDLFTNIYGRSKNYKNKRDLPMSAVYQHPDDSFIIAPYLDLDVGYALTKKKMYNWLNGKNLNGLMIKIADQESGQVLADGSVRKRATEQDKQVLAKGIELSKKILIEAGSDKDSIITTNIYGAHPAGTAAIGKVVDNDLKVKQTKNLYVADASLLPFSMGKPPIVTIMALAKYLGKRL